MQISFPLVCGKMEQRLNVISAPAHVFLNVIYSCGRRKRLTIYLWVQLDRILPNATSSVYLQVVKMPLGATPPPVSYTTSVSTDITNQEAEAKVEYSNTYDNHNNQQTNDYKTKCNHYDKERKYNLNHFNP